ncbi:F-box/kelch-repeat protein At3g23880-like isoform X2 [Rhododendron vialii]|uniref:F-box/kelch-repeat protein At3g23880-like isoform X2 n=1 Tax=Rhododendron vialii TaxID=182163 RepID=UPI00265F7E55|nr:F-box/kelch-repeat protein At3g23880-like isoform X2 [Rhododendron vialii]
MAAVTSDTNTNDDDNGWQKVYSKRNRKRLSNSLQHHRNIPSNSLQHLHNIPVEILSEILSHLPVRSLFRFRCVSKVWRSLISDPKFALDHYSSQKHQKIAINIRSPSDSHDKGSSVVYSVEYDSTAYASSSWIKPMINEDNIEWFQILGSCNGLLLVSYYMDLYLWNPSTRQCTKTLSLTCYWPMGLITKEISASSGLCYDSSVDDYKAVIAYRGKVSVASFKRRIWATTTCCFADGGERVMNSGPVVNGKLHWVINQYENIDFSNQIVYFDPITDEFLELPVPPQPYNFWERKTVILGLGVLEGCLCMARCGCESGTEVEPDFIEVFVMREYGVGESWSNIFIMSNIMGLSRPYVYGNFVPLHFTKNGEVLIAVNRNKLFVYNPNKMPQREILISSGRYEIHVASYAESLASPAAYGHKEDWVKEGEDALELADDGCDWSSCFDSYGRDWEWLYVGADDEDNNWVWNVFWKKEENQEKFKRRYKARLYFLAAKEKNKKRQKRIRTESGIIFLRKNKQESKHGKNMEVDDLHKQSDHF